MLKRVNVIVLREETIIIVPRALPRVAACTLILCFVLITKSTDNVITIPDCIAITFRGARLSKKVIITQVISISMEARKGIERSFFLLSSMLSILFAFLRK